MTTGTDDIGKSIVRTNQDESHQQKRRFGDRFAEYIRDSGLTELDVYRTMVESLPGIFYFVDADQRLRDWNSQFAKVSGYTDEELEGMWALDFFAEQDRAKALQGITLALRDGTTLTEVPFLTKHGTRIPYIFSGHRLIVDDRRCFFGLGLDFSEQKRLEERLAQAQKMESIGSLAGGVAHDFNNILFAMLGTAELLLMQDLSDDVRHDVLRIKKTGERAAKLTRQLLAFSRKQDLLVVSLDVNDALAQLTNLLVRLIGEDVELRLELCSQPCVVMVDAQQFEQVVINLAVNARDAMPNGGVLHISTGIVEINTVLQERDTELKPGSYLVLAVTDSGCGMEKETLERVFDPFFTTKEVGKGTGLGLAMVHGIVRQHGGSVRVSSAPGEGTTFEVLLPIAEGKRSALLSANVKNIDALPRGHGENILLVEDDSAVRESLSRILERYGYRALIAENATVAMTIITRRDDEIDLLLSDVIMPGMNGPEFFAALKKNYPKLLAVFMSGYSRELAKRYPIFDHGVPLLQKPVDVETLLRTLDSIFVERKERQIASR